MQTARASTEGVQLRESHIGMLCFIHFPVFVILLKTLIVLKSGVVFGRSAGGDAKVADSDAVPAELAINIKIYVVHELVE